jgi:hypothetical protein
VTRAEIDEIAEREELQLICFDEFDKAILGIGRKFNGEPSIIYDYEKCVKILMKNNKWPREDALEWMDFNVTGSWLGESTPIFLYRD